MAITYPLSLPASPGFREIVVRPASVVAVSKSPYTGSQEVQVYQGQMWAADITLPRMKQAEAAAWEAFFLKLNGQEGTFLLGDPVRATPNGTASTSPGTPTVSGAHAARVNSLSVTGGPLSETGWLLEGDMIQIGTGSSAKLHAVLENADTDGSGNTTLTIWPKTRAALSGGETIAVSSAKGLFRLGKNIPAFSRESLFTSLQFTVLEAL